MLENRVIYKSLGREMLSDERYSSEKHFNWNAGNSRYNFTFVRFATENDIKKFKNIELDEQIINLETKLKELKTRRNL